MAARAAVHPSDETLQSYGLGKLDDLLAEAVGKHLKDCDACRRRVAEVTSDSLSSRLQNAQARPESIPPVGSSLAGMSKLGGESRTSSPPPASSLPPGLAEHPDYQVLRELGRGGMGVVYLAENRMMGRKEVLKVVNSHLLNRQGVLERFLREIRAAARLHHPNIVTAYAATRVGESIVFAMQYVEGYDLSQLVQKSGPLAVAHACNFVYQAALGLQHAHEHGMVHRDIKPSNLMLAKDGNRPVVKVLDFGLAKVTSEGAVDGGLTHEGQMLGTPHFIAPEQTVSAQKADIRADIYSLGCTLYCLMAGHPPFDAPSLYELLQAHHSMAAKPLNLVRPEVPAELAAVVAKMLAKQPERRFQTPAEVAEALKPFFKKDRVNSKAIKPEISHVELIDPNQEAAEVRTSATQPKTTPGAPAVSGTAGSRMEPEWESLIELKKTAGADLAVAVVSQPKRQWPRWFWPALAGAFSFAMIALGVTIYVATDYGRIKIIVEGPQAEVQVDGKQILIKTPRESVSLRAGEHNFSVKWRDGQFKTDRFVVRRGEDEELHVEYEPRVTDRADTSRQPTPTTGTASGEAAESPSELPAGKPPMPPVPTLPRGATASALPVDGFVSLFNGKNLDGWKVDRGDPRTWSVEDGHLVARALGDWRQMTFLLSERDYTDFLLRFEVQLPENTDSGVEIRAVPGERPFHVEVNLRNFHEPVSLMGGLFWSKSGRRDDILPTSRPVELRPAKDWNDMEIESRGDALRVLVNGRDALITDLRFFAGRPNALPGLKRPSGRIGFQSHTGTVRFRNIMIKELGGGSQNAASNARVGYVSLFDGKNIAGWSAWGNSGRLDQARAAANWWVGDGVLHGTNGPSLLFSPRGDYSNFRVRAEVRINAGGNSGLYFRTAKGPGFSRGYEAQINSTGRDPNKNGSLYRPPQPPIGVRSNLVPPDTWFTLEVEAIGERIQIWVNGTRTVDWGDLQKTHTRGHFAIQVHDPQTHVQIRKLEVMEIDSVGSSGRSGPSTKDSEVPTQPRVGRAALPATATVVVGDSILTRQ